jgi:hypothetical protein
VRIFLSICLNKRLQNVFLVWLPVVVLNSGCITSNAHIVRAAGTKNAPDAVVLPLPSKNGDGADAYLKLLREFKHADARTRAAIYEQASTQAALDATAHHRLQLALLKLSPGHHGYNLQAARTLLQSVVERFGALGEGAVNLAGVYLDAIDERIRLQTANRELAAKLEQAQAKLNALTEIEQTVEQPADDITPSTGGRPDE